MRKCDSNYGGSSNLLALLLGVIIVLPFVGFYWTFCGDKEWKRVVGVLFLLISFIISINK